MNLRTKINDYIGSKKEYFIELFGNRNDVQPIRSEIEDAFKAGYELASSDLQTARAALERVEERGFLADVSDEVNKARAKFPRGRHLLAALMEEVGELANALLEQEYGNGVTSEMVYREAVQVATVAMRIAEEGEDAFPKFSPAPLSDLADDTHKETERA